MASGSGSHFSDRGLGLGTPFFVPGLKQPLYVPKGCYIPPGSEVPVFESEGLFKVQDLSSLSRKEAVPEIKRWWEAMPREHYCGRMVESPPPPVSPKYDEKTDRECVRHLIRCALSMVSEDADERFTVSVNESDPGKVAAEVESVLFENLGARYSNPPQSKQSKMYGALIYFLFNPNIKDLRRQLLLGEITPQRLVCMSEDELGQMYPPQNSLLGGMRAAS